MKISELKKTILEGGLDQQLTYLYGEENVAFQKDRYITLLDDALNAFGDEEAKIISAPGRTEVGGNHTDHQLGKVLAASIHLDCVGVVIPTSDNIVTYQAKDFQVKPVDLNVLEIQPEEKNTTESLIRGVANRFVELGYQIGGFKCYATSNVIAGGGMSSSAAFETLLGTIQSVIYNDNKVNPVEIAQIGQYAENVYFMKPSGLMDQMACSVGSFVSIDFYDQKNPVVTKVPFDLAKYGYDLILTDVKASHADLSDEYGLVPQEMKDVAKVLGQEVLSRLTLEDLLKNAKQVREQCGDRAYLRSYHFLNETIRAQKEADALNHGDIQTFFDLVNESGRSSYMYLQNINVPGATTSQPVAIALALSEAVLQGKGAFRVHGGGFAGTIQAFVPHDLKQQYIEQLESVFGEGSCYVLRIREVGGYEVI